MSELRLHRRIIKLLANLLGTRTIHFYRNGRKIDTRKISKEAAKDRVSSPLAFNTYVKDINKNIGKKCKIAMYADDASLYTIRNSEQECISAQEDGIKHLLLWLKKLKLNISISKTKFMILSRKKRLQGNLQIEINNDRIERSDSARFLGVILDTKLK